MHDYRVIFKNNIPQSAMRVEVVNNKELVHLTTNHGHKCMDWLVVPGDDEVDAIWVAANMMRTIWLNYLNNPINYQ